MSRAQQRAQYLIRVGQKGVGSMETIVVKILKNIKQSAELVFQHYESRGFKNTLTEVGLKNIIALAQEGIDQIEQTHKQE
jgi:hypothetical protein